MSRKTKSTQVNTVQRTPGFDRLARTTIDRAIDQYDGKLDQYEGDRFADFSDDELAAQDRIKDLTSRDFSGDQNDLLNLAISRYSKAPNEEDLRGFMNPYQDLVTDRAIDETIDRGNDAMARLRLGLGKSGSWGSSGMYLGQARLADDTADRIGDMLAESKRDNYNQAYDRYMGQAANAMGTAGALDALTRSDIALLDASGLNQRNLEQAKKDFDFSEFDLARRIGRQDAGSLAGVLASYPTQSFDTKSTQTSKTSDPWGTAIGLGAMAGGLFGAQGAFPNLFGGGGSAAATTTSNIGNAVSSGIGAVSSSGFVGPRYSGGGPVREEDGIKMSEGEQLFVNQATDKAKEEEKARAMETPQNFSRGEQLLINQAVDRAREKPLQMPSERPLTFADRIDRYFENPLTKLGISILSADSVGEGLSNFANDQQAEKDRQKQEAFAKRQMAIAEEQRNADNAFRNTRLALDEENARANRELSRWGIEMRARDAAERRALDQSMHDDRIIHEEYLDLTKTGRDLALQDKRAKLAKDLEGLKLRGAITKDTIDFLVRNGMTFDEAGSLVGINDDNLEVVYKVLKAVSGPRPDFPRAFEYTPRALVPGSTLESAVENASWYPGEWKGAPSEQSALEKSVYATPAIKPKSHPMPWEPSVDFNNLQVSN